eukprot:1230548-Pyramimonas_sp.AAC.1
MEGLGSVTVTKNTTDIARGPLKRSRRASNCAWSLGIWRFRGCRSCCARDVPTPRALNNITADIWKLGMLKLAVSAS